MKYKGYTGVVEFDEESGSLYGRVIGLRDVITFQGESVAEVTQAFRDSVDDYLEFCAKRGRTPEKPYSGQFVLRIDPGLHRAVPRRGGEGPEPHLAGRGDAGGAIPRAGGRPGT